MRDNPGCCQVQLLVSVTGPGSCSLTDNSWCISKTFHFKTSMAKCEQGCPTKKAQTARLENVHSCWLNFGWYNPNYNLKTKLMRERVRGGGARSVGAPARMCNRRHATPCQAPSSPVIALPFLSDLLLWSSGLGDCFLSPIALAFLFQFSCLSIAAPRETFQPVALWFLLPDVCPWKRCLVKTKYL